MTPMQKRILWALRKHDTDILIVSGNHSRTQGFGFWPLGNGALCVRAYQSPDYFMRCKGWLEPAGGNYGRHFLRLTAAGKVQQAKIGDTYP